MRLTDEQVSLIVNSWTGAIPEDKLKADYWQRRIEKEKPLPQDDDLAALGYSPSEIEAIMAELNRV